MADDTTVVKDQVYSFEIARRAVGRAALHLGIDSMTEQTLDVMADVLLQYLARTGQALSHLVESSRRTSAHVNVLDAFQACQLVTSPAVGRLHLQDPEEEDELIVKSSQGIDGKSAIGNAGGPSNGSSIGASSSTNHPSSGANPTHSSTGWKGLAAFVFGPKWLEEKEEEDYLIEKSLAAANAATSESATGEASSSTAAGGKVFPSNLENDTMVPGDLNMGAGDMSTLGGSRRRKKQGWNAPFPDSVSLFPRASATCANPHALPAKLGLSSAKASTATTVYRKVEIDPEEAEEHEQEVINELEAVPDGVFAPEVDRREAVNSSSWGSMDGRNKRTLEQSNSEKDGAFAKDQDGDIEMKPTSKKVKIAIEKNVVVPNKSKSDSTSGDGEDRTKNEDSSDQMPEEFLYVPSFYPQPPSTKVVVDDRRTVVDGFDEQQERLLQQQRTQEQQNQQISGPSSTISSSLRNAININSSEGVRTSLVRLGNTYWGSGWDRSSSSASTIAVPMGRKVGGPTSAGGSSTPDDPIVPMSRASGSRVSRVLEGSMDAAAMQ